MVNMSEVVAARLRHMGVDRVYGTPGLAVDPLVDALRGAPGGPAFVQARGEESAALMACADAKLTGGLGCCVAPPGAGALRLLGGLYDAAADRAPVLALVGADPAPRGTGNRTVRHLAEVSVYCEEVSGPELAGDALRRAARAAVTDRGVASLVVPRRVLEADLPGAPPGEDGALIPARPARRPAADDVRRAAEALCGAARPVIVLGNAGRAAAGAATGVARLLGAGIVTTALARDALPDGLPYLAGVAGPLGSEAAATLLRECDTLLLLGAEDVDPAVLPAPRAGRIVTVDREPGDCPLAAGVAAVRLTGDVTACLRAVLPLLHRAGQRAWRNRVERLVRDWRADGEARSSRYFGTSVNPRSVVAELSERLPDRSVVVTDSGTALDWWTRHLRLRNGMRSLLSGQLGTPGAAVPYAVAARFAAPDRPVIALVGDGAFQSGGLNELITVRRHLDRLAQLPPLVFCVLNNGDLNRLTWQRRAAARDPLVPPSAEVPALPYAELARLAGLPAVRCDRPRFVASVWAGVLAGRGPVVLEFVVDGEMPPDWAEAGTAARGTGRNASRNPLAKLLRVPG
ncbi:thiamine pyrophosphate-requiring protein [Streptomyces capoamus]|uniref:Thiamine pyrophosphate-requiring protein n=2 Tax=Streptomyces capoamus TaxID=68183 RepID=A0A919KDZ6_9ACTN|nr:thiamine pyrophosphate-requiring protein [Streptomyces libani subsp. rufus]GHG61680.1 thiamine pyrophosphate-requiring protein [Streptomyces capoamus]